MTARPLLQDALSIWHAGLDAVRPEKLIPAAIRVADGEILFQDCRGDLAAAVPMARLGQIHVVGGGKAGAAMVRGLESALGDALLATHRVHGVVSTPEDCVGPTRCVRLVGGRPPGVNEPRPAAAAATAEMLRIVRSAAPDDLVICLLSGGGSALLTAPRAPLTVHDKAVLAQRMSARGATIHQLNTVRQHLSDVKGGGLARACRARRILTLVISDVPGDPLDLIASGPTIAARQTPEDALQVLHDLDLLQDPELRAVVEVLRQAPPPTSISAQTETVMLANNAAAVDAAGIEAERLGYRHAMTSATEPEGLAEAVGERLATLAIEMRDHADGVSPNCLIAGGEPTVELAPPEVRGRGGRNQQLALAALRVLGDCRGVAIVSGGTDGEDGPTPAAGAMIDEALAQRVGDDRAALDDALRRNDAYTFFERAEGLLVTGPTHTNVCDLRVITTGGL
ncbi:glycerate kinase type-2 family protein [Botrimarina hoheduenensis]|uniref:Putative hydroxypyruvate reductase n=1 Tax=Botrimarina hoheduenensis TaxID=2528000 RepID=A0A5C5WD51_9BACT|nr:DUF4147 domain-containing protein [Botrimarina hoheduenensis]TWT47592.1 putative hydroxypyruvate reductase [Botrimarina hoheduenensis]